MNHKLILYIATVAILQPLTSQAKQKTFSPKKIAIQNISQPIEVSYLLQINLAQADCQNLLEQSCFFRDKMQSEPYFHQTKLTIFLNKVFATQYYNDKSKLLQVKDGAHSLTSNNGNLISFNTKTGEINNLKLIKGNIKTETNGISKCQKAENLYNFYNIYNKTDQIFIKSRLYKDEYNFNGLDEYILFAEKNNQAEIMALKKNTNSAIEAIHNIHLCKMPDRNVLNVRHISAEECFKSDRAIEECAKYENCEDKIIVEDCEINLFRDGFI